MSHNGIFGELDDPPRAEHHPHFPPVVRLGSVERIDRTKTTARWISASISFDPNDGIEWYTDRNQVLVVQTFFLNNQQVVHTTNIQDDVLIQILTSKGYTVTPPAPPALKEEPENASQEIG
jgi:hypothetical protein